MRELAQVGQVDYEPDKALLSVADRLGRTLDEAKLEIRRIVELLTPDDFYRPGHGYPPPPCDAYRVTAQYYVHGIGWDPIEWYVKIGVSYGATPADDVLWVESCHD